MVDKAWDVDSPGSRIRKECTSDPESNMAESGNEEKALEESLIKKARAVFGERNSHVFAPGGINGSFWVQNVYHGAN